MTPHRLVLFFGGTHAPTAAPVFTDKTDRNLPYKSSKTQRVLYLTINQTERTIANAIDLPKPF